MTETEKGQVHLVNSLEDLAKLEGKLVRTPGHDSLYFRTEDGTHALVFPEIIDDKVNMILGWYGSRVNFSRGRVAIHLEDVNLVSGRKKEAHNPIRIYDPRDPDPTSKLMYHLLLEKLEEAEHPYIPRK